MLLVWYDCNSREDQRKKTKFADKIHENLFIQGNSDLGNGKVLLLVSMISQLTLNVGLITGLRPQKGNHVLCGKNRSAPTL